MYRIRLHGRGGQGLKTASRILGTALFLEGFEVQDAPRYGAERRGAPIFAYVRAGKHQIQERGVITLPDLVIVTDDSLMSLPSAGILGGLSDHTVLLICSHETSDTWQDRLSHTGPIVTIPGSETGTLSDRFISTQCVGAACRLLGIVTSQSLAESIRSELESYPEPVIDENVQLAQQAYDLVSGHNETVIEGGIFRVSDHTDTDWVELRSEEPFSVTPAIAGSLTSVTVRTGLWRTLRPVIEYEHCNRCNWVCSNFCPDNAISVAEDAYPHIDLDHCKGCMICVEQCPPHAIVSVPEAMAQQCEDGQPEAQAP